MSRGRIVTAPKVKLPGARKFKEKKPKPTAKQLAIQKAMLKATQEIIEENKAEILRRTADILGEALPE